MADNPLQQQFFAQALGISPEQQKKLMSAQQQEALAQALLQQGSIPIDTNNRQIGGVGYKVSPLEGVAKLADILSGKYQQNNANENLANALQPQSGGQGQSQQADPIVAAMPPPTQQLFNRLSLPEAMGGNPRAAIELYGQYGSGMKAYGTKTGENAAGLAPASALPAGVGQPQQPPQTLPMSPPQQGAPPQLGTQPPIMPVQGGVPLPPVGQNAPPSPAGGGTSAIAQGAAPVSASALAPPSGIIPPPATPAAMPTPNAGESFAAYQARLEAAKAGAVAQAGVAPAGEKTQAEDTGKNIADSIKTFNVAAGQLPRAMQRFNQLRQASQQASYGGGVSEEDPGSMTGDYARNYARTSVGQMMEPQRATANQIIDQATKQGVLSELGPQLAGLRGNKFLESIASGASGLNPADPPPAKINAINGLQDQYISNLKSLAQQRRSYGDPTAPSDMDLAGLISKNADPSTMVNVVDPMGRAGKVAAQHLPDLIQAGGQIK